MIAAYQQDPDEVLDYGVDWGLWLRPGDTISASTWAASSVNVTLSGDNFDDTSTVVFASLGGTVAVDDVYTITNHVTTAAGREADQTISIKVVTA